LDYPRRDPAGHERTTRRHAGESIKNAANTPGLAGVAVAVVALIVGLFALAIGHVVVGCVAVILAAVCAAAGAGWLVFAHHRVNRAELRQWEAKRSDAPPAQQLTARGVACCPRARLRRQTASIVARAISSVRRV
jgi:hypothetical protein